MVPRIRVVHPRLQALRGASSWMEVHPNICTRHAVLCTHRGSSHRGSAEIVKTISGKHKHTETHPSISEKWILFAVVDWCWLPFFCGLYWVHEPVYLSISHKQTLSICFELVAMGMGLPTLALFLHVFFSKTLRMSLRIVCWLPFVLWDGPWQLWAWRPHWASMADQRILWLPVN